MEDVCIFIDESGAHGFNFEKDGVTDFYVIAVIIIDKKYKNEFLNNLQIIYKELTTSPKPKANILNKNSNMRDMFIEKISKLHFSYFTLIVDKREINLTSGLVWKPSFYKYFQAMCYNRFIYSYQNIEIYADEYGGKEFQDSFIKYIDLKFESSLFKTINIKYTNSSSEDLEKYGCFLADNISGIVRYNLEQNVELNTIFSSLSKHFLGKIVFPINKKNIDAIVVENTEDSIIRKISLEKAFKFLESNKNKFIENNREAIVLQFLILESLISNNEYLFSDVIEDFISENYNILLSKNELKQTIIKNLRDQDVLISSSNKGYKLTTSKRDLIDYIDLKQSFNPAFIFGSSIILKDEINDLLKQFGIAFILTEGPLLYLIKLGVSILYNIVASILNTFNSLVYDEIGRKLYFYDWKSKWFGAHPSINKSFEDGYVKGKTEIKLRKTAANNSTY